MTSKTNLSFGNCLATSEDAATPLTDLQDSLNQCSLVTDADIDQIVSQFIPERQELARHAVKTALRYFDAITQASDPVHHLSRVMDQAGIEFGALPSDIRAAIAVQLGKRCICARRYSRAIQYFNDATRLFPREATYYCFIGQVWYCMLIENKMTEDLIPEDIRVPLIKAIELDPDYDEPYLFLGYISKHNQEYERALTEFRKALIINPQNRSAMRELGEMYDRLGEYQSAGQ